MYIYKLEYDILIIIRIIIQQTRCSRVMNFEQLGISKEMTQVLYKKGIKEPTEIQKQCIQPISDGRDIIADAKTGTGKTLAFLLPIFKKMTSNSDHVQCLILTPTRELAIQISQEAKNLNEDGTFNILCAYGGTDLGSQLKKLKNNVDLIIATPGRLMDHIRRKTIVLEKLNIMVFDEADQMLLMGFKNEVNEIMQYVNKKSQVLCFSATINTDVKKLAYRYCNDPLIISVKTEEVTLKNIKQQLVETTDRHKLEALCTVLDQDNPFLAIIFCRTIRRVEKLEEELHKKGYNCNRLHGDMPQSKRERVMKDFKSIKLQYLVATEIVARGIDVNGITHVYNYDIPESVESYIHRIGRTGRVGEIGYTCLFIDPKDRNLLKDIEEKIEMNISVREI